MLAHASIIFVIGAVLQSASYSVAQMIVGRIVLGLGVGCCSAEVPLYLSEVAPANIRGQLIAIEQMVLCLGEMVAFWANYGFAYLGTNHWWRISISLQIIAAIALGGLCYFWVLPSPRWLAMQDRRDEAQEVLIRLHGTDKAQIEMDMLNQQLELENSVDRASWRELFQFPLLKITMNGTLVQFFQQATGTISLVYYAPTLFMKGGISDPNTANLCSGGIGVMLFVTSFLPMWLFDKLGRRTWLTIGTIGINCSLVGVIVCQWHAEHYPNSNGNYAIIAFPYLFYLFFNLAWSCGSWTYAAEIAPLRMRAKANALSTATLWTTAFAVSQLTPVISDAISWGLYIIYIGLNCVALLFIRFVMVETRGITLEEMSQKFGIVYEEQRLVSGGGDDSSIAKGSVELVD